MYEVFVTDSRAAKADGYSEVHLLHKSMLDIGRCVKHTSFTTVMLNVAHCVQYIYYIKLCLVLFVVSRILNTTDAPNLSFYIVNSKVFLRHSSERLEQAHDTTCVKLYKTAM